MNDRFHGYLDETERAVARALGKAKAKSVRNELEAHLEEALAEAIGLGLEPERAATQVVASMGEIDPSAYGGLGSTSANRLRGRVAAGLTAIMLLGWPWVGWLWINPIYNWAIPLSLGTIIATFFVIGLRSPRPLIGPVLLTGIAASTVNGLLMPITFVQYEFSVPALRERGALAKDTDNIVRMLPQQERANDNLVALNRYYSSPGANKDGALRHYNWKRGELVYPRKWRGEGGRLGYGISWTSDFEVARRGWLRGGDNFVRSQEATVYMLRDALSRNQAALGQSYLVTARSTLASTGLFLVGYLMLAASGVFVGQVASLVTLVLERAWRRISARS